MKKLTKKQIAAVTIELEKDIIYALYKNDVAILPATIHRTAHIMEKSLKLRGSLPDENTAVKLLKKEINRTMKSFMNRQSR